jgi:tRNA 2-thiouridine synthesizing protein A
MNATSREDGWQNARELDLTGLKCPLPSLMTARALRTMKEGERLAVTVTDPLAPLDLKHLCGQEGHRILAEAQNDCGARRLLICRGAPPVTRS